MVDSSSPSFSSHDASVDSSSSVLPHSSDSLVRGVKFSPTRPARIALAGNPNSGKTSVFNALTGLRYKVANYPGVTVEKKEGKLALPNISHATLIDLPGSYSLDTYAFDEQIATSVLLGEFRGESAPDLIVAVVDSTNLERNLFFTSQLLDLGIPVVIALSMTDLAESQGISIRTEILSRLLGAPVVAICAKVKKGIESLRSEIENSLESHSTGVGFRWLSAAHALVTSVDRLADLATLLSPPVRHPKIHALSILSGSQVARSSELKVICEEEIERLRVLDVDAATIEATLRYQWIGKVVRQSTSAASAASRSLTQRLDAVLTHRVFGLMAFAAIMALMFQSIFVGASLPMEWIDMAVAWIGASAAEMLPEGQFRSLVVDGMIAGVGSVLIFIPQIAILFFFIGLLEDSGYLARAAYVTDRVMRKFGLQGRSFVPLLSSFACAIPGILSARTIPTLSDRFTTIMVAPLMSCSARLPVYSLLIAAFIPAYVVGGIFSLQGLVMLGLYLLGVVTAMLVASVLKLTVLRGEPAPFVMEMPLFRRPSLRVVVRNVLDRVLLFVQSAGTIILACSLVMWFLASYPRDVNIEQSYAGRIGHAIEPALAPLGLGWEVGIGIVASFAAREVFVSSLATVYNLGDDDTAPTSLLHVLNAQHASGEFTLAAALALLVFYVYACMCMSTLAVTRRETGSWSWTIFMFVYMTALGYGAALLTYQGALYFGLGGNVG